MIIKITGKDNKTLKLVRSVLKKKGRLDTGLYFAEGARIVTEALAYADNDIKFVLAGDSFYEKNQGFINSLDEKGKTVYTAPDRLFCDVCDTETPQGIGVVLNIPASSVPPLSELSFVLILDRISEPGNLGTIIRTAEAAGVEAVFMTKGCTDLYSPKTVRSTMGSLFRMKCITDAGSLTVSELKKAGFTVAATALNNSVPITKTEISGRRAIVIGSEAFGVSDEILNMSDIKVRIPMEGSVESLNAAVAAGISMYFLKP